MGFLFSALLTISIAAYIKKHLGSKKKIVACFEQKPYFLNPGDCLCKAASCLMQIRYLVYVILKPTMLVSWLPKSPFYLITELL